jgi:long-chain acyl-CoA synthetase
MVLGGEKRDYLSVIIIIDFENVGKWAEESHLSYTTFADLSQRAEVANLLKQDLHRINKDFPDEMKIRKFVLLHKEFDPDEEELTRTRKLRRSYMEKRYSELVGAIYSDRDSVAVESVVRYRDGRERVTTTGIKIRSATEEDIR